ncbi:MAG: hypothetical protein HYR85_07700 [Planctomycetes bacterium]|nr:hypothetical protein [Planctomycetota bacterium]MBI3843837.1 hypothetical protein [Planctomycetota bacterium]
MNAVALVLGLALAADDVAIRRLWDSIPPETREAFGHIHIACEAPSSAPATPPEHAGFAEFLKACHVIEASPGPLSWIVEGATPRRVFTACCTDSRMAPTLAANEWVVIDGGGPIEPHRFDVIAIRGAGESTSFARVLGLPGERIDILNGDLYVNNRIVRKPDGLQSIAWLPLESLAMAADRWKWPAGVSLGADGSVRLPAELGKTGLEIVRRDAGRLQGRPDSISCTDLRVEATVLVEAGGAATIEITDGPFVARAEIGANAFTLRLQEYDEDDAVYRDVRSEKGSIVAATHEGTMRVALENADDAVSLERDGQRLARIEFDSNTEGGSSTVKVGAVNGAVVMRDVIVRRDLHWKRGDRHDYPVTVAPGRLFVAADAFDATGDSRFVTAAAGVSGDAVLGRAVLAVDSAKKIRRIY